TATTGGSSPTSCNSGQAVPRRESPTGLRLLTSTDPVCHAFQSATKAATGGRLDHGSGNLTQISTCGISTLQGCHATRVRSAPRLSFPAIDVSGLEAQPPAARHGSLSGTRIAARPGPFANIPLATPQSNRGGTHDGHGRANRPP